jgi:molybdate transport system substrate-binding protein
VAGILDKVTSGEADAGFVYATDAQAAGDEVRAIELPAQALAEHVIAIAVESEHREAADAFVELLLGEEGRRALEEAGFGLPRDEPLSPGCRGRGGRSRGAA